MKPTKSLPGDPRPGMAIGSGTDVVKETGNILLIKDDIRDVVVTLDVAKAIIREAERI